MTDFSISAPVALFTGAALLLVVLGLVALALDRRRVHRRQQRFQGLLEYLAHDRPGRIVKVTPTYLHIAWTAPSSGKTRVVPVRLNWLIEKHVRKAFTGRKEGAWR